jgi:hypothetical protein
VTGFDSQVSALLLKIGKRENDPIRREIEQRIAEILSSQGPSQVDAFEVIVHGFDTKSVRTTSRNDEAGMLVRRLPEPKPFEQDSILFASINASYSEGSVEVYAPVSWSDRTQRSKLLKALKQPIREAIESIAGAARQGVS